MFDLAEGDVSICLSDLAEGDVCQSKLVLTIHVQSRY